MSGRPATGAPDPSDPSDPSVPSDPSDPSDPSAVAALLATRRGELEAELARLSAPVDQGGISFGKRVGDGTSMAVERITQVAAHERLQESLADVVRAEAKLDEGSYGTCDVCGRPIAPGRLEALPSATRCVEDAARR